MRNLKRLVIGITFSAMLATMLVATGGHADAGTRQGGNAQQQGTGQTTTPRAGGALLEALGVTWE